MTFTDHKPDDIELREQLSGILDPDTGTDIQQAGLVTGASMDGSTARVALKVPNPSPTYRTHLESLVQDQLQRLSKVSSVEFQTSLEVNTRAFGEASKLIPKVKNAIAVASGKGGVGKSTVATNLATALHAFGARVGLMDADVYGPSIPILMGAFEQPQVTAEHRIIPPEIRGIKLISMGYFLPKDDAVIWRGPMLHKMIQDFLGLVEWGELDYLVIDLPPGTGDIQLSLCQTIPLTGSVVVSTPQDLALEVASKAIAMFKKLNTPVLGLVENMSHYTCPHCGQRDDVFGHGGTRTASAQLGYPFLGEIPLSMEIRKRSDQGEPVALDPADSPLGKAYQDLASAVASRVNIANATSRPSLSIEQ